MPVSKPRKKPRNLSALISFFESLATEQRSIHYLGRIFKKKSRCILMKYRRTLHLLFHIRTSSCSWFNSNMYKELEDLFKLKRQILMSFHAELRRQLENSVVFNNERVRFVARKRLIGIIVLARGCSTI